MKRQMLTVLLAFVAAGCGGDFNHGGDFTAKLCGGYILYKGSAHDAQVTLANWNHQAPYIPAKVVELGNDERFIIAKQNHLRRLSPNSTYMAPETDAYSYWILDTSISKAYGPLTRDEFQRERRDLGVPDQITLKDISSYRR